MHLAPGYSCHSEKSWVWGRNVALELGSPPHTGCHAHGRPCLKPLHLIPPAFAGLRCSYLSLSPPPHAQEASPVPGQAGSHRSGPWPPGLRQNCLQLGLISLLVPCANPACHSSPCIVCLPCTLVGSLTAEPVPSSFMILQGLAQGLACSRCSGKFCEMHE